MMTKFNQEFYAQIKAKKNKPLSSIVQRRLQVVEKEKEKEVTKKGSSTLALDEGHVTSLALSIEEITLRTKKRKLGDKGKDKVGASVWADAKTTLAQANEVVTPEELKEISSVPSHEMVNHHVHKLIQVIFFYFLSFFCFSFFSFFFFLSISMNYISCSLRDFGCQVLGETMHITSQYLVNEEKVVMATSKVEALEAEALGLRKNLIAAMDANNSSKEKIKSLTEELNAEKQLVK